MRQIGTLPRELDPRAFADYLLSLGVKTRIDDRPEGWDVWIYNEDQIPQARAELEGYLLQPDAPRYRVASQAAEVIRREEKRRDREFRKNDRDASDLWGYPTFRKRPLSTLLLWGCVVIFLLQNIPTGQWGKIPTGWDFTNRLRFSPIEADAMGRVHDLGLEPIERGEVWRLVTPAMMHGNPLHIAFNLIWLRLLGTLIEVRRGTFRLAILFLISAAVSNYGQYLWMERMDRPAAFLGMSGVIYAFFGYVWMKGVYQPEQRMAVSPGNVNIMLIWLVLCMTGALGPIANAAHFVGVVVGIAFGLLGF